VLAGMDKARKKSRGIFQQLAEQRRNLHKVRSRSCHKNNISEIAHWFLLADC
jgi:hypothetical protein